MLKKFRILNMSDTEEEQQISDTNAPENDFSNDIVNDEQVDIDNNTESITENAIETVEDNTQHIITEQIYSEPSPEQDESNIQEENQIIINNEEDNQIKEELESNTVIEENQPEAMIVTSPVHDEYTADQIEELINHCFNNDSQGSQEQVKKRQKLFKNTEI